MDAWIMKVLCSVSAAGILAAISMMWNLDKQVALNSERISQVLLRSDKNDEEIRKTLLQIERMVEKR